VKREVLGRHTHVLIAANACFPVAHDQLGVALNERFASDSDAVWPTVGLSVFNKIIELVESLLKQGGDKRVGDDGRIGLSAQQRFPGLAHRAVLIPDLPFDLPIGIDACLTQLMLEPHRCNAALVPVSDSLSFEISDGLNAGRGHQGAGKPIAPTADDAYFIIAEATFSKGSADMDVRNDINAKGDHVAQNSTDFVVPFAIGPAGLDGFRVDLGVDDLDIESFPRKQAGFHSIGSGTDVPGMPAPVTYTQFHTGIP
jgi:hypothetical protein